MWVFQVTILFCVFTAFTVKCEVSESLYVDQNGKIVGGSEIPISKVPFQAAMIVNNQLGCGGSIIGDRQILTAAHCVVGLSAKQIKFRLGSSDALSGGQVVQATKISVHSSYNARSTDFDVAVVQVGSTITSGKKISLGSSQPAAGSKVYVSGWGSTRSGGTTTRKLRGVEISAVSRNTCNNAYGQGTITARMICASGSGKDSCQGDSGGPLTADNKIVGIVSWGAGCADKKYPGVYTNVADPSIRNFITRNINMS